MNVLVGKLRRMAEDKALPIGESWNALDEAADMIEEMQACLEAFCERDYVYLDSEIKGTLQCSCSCCIRAFNVIEKSNSVISVKLAPELQSEIKGRNMKKFDEYLLDRAGWCIECESPFEIQHSDGSSASGQAAKIVLESLREEAHDRYENDPEEAEDDC